MRLNFSQLRGEVPKTPLYENPHNVATSTMDVDLRDGRLRAWRDTTLVYYSEEANSFFIHGCDYLTWSECVSMAATSVDAGALVLVGRKEYAEQMRLKGGAREYAALGLPVPPAPRVSTKNEEQRKDSYPTNYVVTYVNKYGQESAPSAPSNTVVINEETGIRVEVGDLPISVGNQYRVEAINIYRLAMPYRSGEEDKPLEDDGLYLKVATVKFGQRDYVDTLLTVNASHPLMTQEHREAPKGMQQILNIPGTNSFVGFAGHKLHFSENNRWWNWPSGYDMTLDRHIKHIAISNGRLIVSTTGAPYIVSDLRTCEKRICRPVDEVPSGAIGDIGCDTLNGSVATPFGMVYSSKEGLTLVSPEGKVSIITAPYFSSKQWAEMRPDSVKLGYWSGLLLCHTETTAFFMRLDSEMFYTENAEGITRISDSIRAIHTNTDGHLFLLKDDGVHHWNSAPTFRTFHWSNKHIGADMTQSFTAYRARGYDATITFKGNDTGREVNVTNLESESERLPRLGRNSTYTITMEGKGFVSHVLIGSSILEVSRQEGE